MAGTHDTRRDGAGTPNFPNPRPQMTLEQIQDQLLTLTNPEQALFLQRFFKTGSGQYGEGDLFRGIRVPGLRRLAKEGQALPLGETEQLLQSVYHEDRLLALLILVRKFASAFTTRIRRTQVEEMREYTLAQILFETRRNVKRADLTAPCQHGARADLYRRHSGNLCARNAGQSTKAEGGAWS